MGNEGVANATISVFQAMHPSSKVSNDERLAFMKAMRDIGFVDSWDLKLLEARYVDGYSYRRICEELNYTGKTTVEYRLKALHKKLVERGYRRAKK